MKQVLLLLLFFFTVNCCAGQQQEVDSLEAMLKNNGVNDTVRINALNDLAFDYAAINTEKGIKYADEVIAWSLQHNNQKKLGTAYNYKALNYAQMGRDSLAVNFYQKAIAIARANNNRRSETSALNNLAILYTNRAEYRKALGIKLRVLTLIREMGNEQYLGRSLANIGVTYFYTADYPKALSYYFQALKQAQKISDEAGAGTAYLNIGLVYKKVKNGKAAFEYYQKALTIFKKRGDLEEEGSVLNDIGAIYDDKGNYSEATKLYGQALGIFRKIGLKRGEASSLSDLGGVYADLKLYTKAVCTFGKALAIYKVSPDENTMSEVYNQLAGIYLDSPIDSLVQSVSTKKDKLKKAEEYALLSLRLSKSSGSVEREMNTWLMLSAIHESLGGYKEALDDHKHYARLRDSLFSDEKQLAIRTSELKYDYERKETLAKSELGRQKLIKNIIVAGAILLFVLLALLFRSYKSRRDAKQLQQELLLRTHISDVEMRVLRLQLNPHFIFNSLNSISDYIIKNDVKTADYYLAKFARLMRMILEKSEEHEVSLAEELLMNELYIQLEAMRLNNSFEYRIAVAETIDRETTMVPPLILQPFVENSIWHGLIGKKNGGMLLIDISEESGMIHCVIEDNGIGRKPQPGVLKKSYGVKITRERIDMINQRRNTNASMVLTDLEAGTRVDIKLPLNLQLI